MFKGPKAGLLLIFSKKATVPGAQKTERRMAFDEASLAWVVR